VAATDAGWLFPLQLIGWCLCPRAEWAGAAPLSLRAPGRHNGIDMRKGRSDVLLRLARSRAEGEEDGTGGEGGRKHRRDGRKHRLKGQEPMLELERSSMTNRRCVRLGVGRGDAERGGTQRRRVWAHL